MDSRERAILKTLLYSNFFDYPLKEEEIYKFLIVEQKIGKKEFHSLLKNIKAPVKSNEDFYFLPGRNKLVKIRKERAKISLKKLQKAEKIIKILAFIPTIELIGISGALSMQNCEKDDDVDIFVVTKKGLVWTTRFLMVIFLRMLGVYRNKNSKDYSDKICLNMLLDESQMALEKNLYIAHEITQLLPLFARDNAYQRFLQKNNWVKHFMVNALKDDKQYLKKNSGVMDDVLTFLFKFFAFEKITKLLQLNYMKKDITNEIVRNDILRLHPFDYGSRILRNYSQKLKEFKI